MSIRLLDIFNYIKWTYFSFFAKTNTKYKSNLFIDTVVVVKLLLACSIFYYSWYEHRFWLWIAVLFAITTFASIAEAILFENSRPSPSSYIRATFLGIMNYVELVFHFASFYALSQSLKLTDNPTEILEKIDYLYFSFITVSTIGFGHLTIKEDVGYQLVIAQTFVFLMFVLVFFNLNVSRINSKKAQ